MGRSRLAAWAVCFSGLMLAACAATPSAEGESEDEIAKRTRKFGDVNPDAPLTGVPKEKILRALVKLDRVSREAETPLRRNLAKETLARIEGGDVLLGSIEASRGIDRWHMCKDEQMEGCDGPSPPSDDWRGSAALAKKLKADLAGYQWGNRIYFSLDASTDIDELAVTLVHEVVHVLNRSECSYYRVIEAHEVEPDLAYVEEFRSFVSECYFRDEPVTVAGCTESAAGRVGEYGFDAKLSNVPGGDKEKLTTLILAAEDGATPRFGRLVPRKRDWPSRFDACPKR